MAKKPEQPASYLGLPPGTLNGATAERARKILRELWHQRSWQKKAALARATDAEGFTVCEQCKRRAPKVHVDHIVKCAEPDAEFLARLFIEPAHLQVLCLRCHGDKTWCERLDFFVFGKKAQDKADKKAAKLRIKAEKKAAKKASNKKRHKKTNHVS